MTLSWWSPALRCRTPLWTLSHCLADRVEPMSKKWSKLWQLIVIITAPVVLEVWRQQAPSRWWQLSDLQAGESLPLLRDHLGQPGSWLSRLFHHLNHFSQPEKWLLLIISTAISIFADSTSTTTTPPSRPLCQQCWLNTNIIPLSNIPTWTIIIV